MEKSEMKQIDCKSFVSNELLSSQIGVVNKNMVLTLLDSQIGAM